MAEDDEQHDGGRVNKHTNPVEDIMANSRQTVRKERSPRSWWFDPRLATGVVLVIASVVGVYAVIASSNRSVLVYAASSTLNAGDRVHRSDLVATSVQLGDAGARYLTQTDVPADGVLLTRSVSTGELVPASAVGLTSSIRVASVVISVKGQLSVSIAPGSVVDVWSAALAEDRHFGPPAVLVGSATVVRVLESSGIISDGQARAVELLVPRDRIARVLQASADGDAVSLVPVSVPVTR